MARTLVSFHAHPDDEAILTAGTLARAVAEGDRVVLVFATRGGVGEADPSLLVAGESLADLRSREAEASAAAIGAHRVVFLGYLDSGDDAEPPGEAAPTLKPGSAKRAPATHAEPAQESITFATANVDEAAAKLAELLVAEGADVLTTYDRNGGYGHPDHVQVHRVGQRAAEMAGTPQVLEATFDRGLLAMAAQMLPSLELDLPEDFEPPDVSGWYSEADEITHRVDVTGFLDRKRASMAAHGSQASSDGGLFRTMASFVALPDELFAMAFGTEWFIDPSDR